MISNRKLVIWLFSLLVALVLYFVLTWSSGLPRIIVNKSAQEPLISDSNTGQPSGGVGMLGDVGVGGVQKAKFTHLNDKKEIDREFGFEKLLHEVGNEWEIEKPFMNIFKKDFECKITADSGKVQVQTAGGKPAPKDASLNGNVVIHIVPSKGSSVKESFIYLDDIIYISERSQFSTDGPVKFVSPDAKMTGKGLELIYNEQTGRVDFLRIMRVDELTMKVPAKRANISTGGNRMANSVNQGGRLQIAGAGTMTADDHVIKSGTKSSRKDKKGDYYKCALNGNVIISSPQQMVFADQLLINDIYQSKDKKSQDDSKQNSVTNETATGPNEPGKPNELNKAQEFTDVKVTCDNGIVATPMDSKIAYAAPVNQPATAVSERLVKGVGEANKRAAFAAKKVDYDMLTGTIVMDGDCLCTGFKQEVNGLRKYTLSGQKITVTLSSEKEKREFAWAEGVKKVVAEGGVVQLATARMMGEKILGFSKLKCVRFEYDGDSEDFTAKGPGIIAIDNSKLEQPQHQKEKPRKFGLKRQCYAVVRDFETLTYSLESNKLVADNSGGGLVIDYFPIVNGKTGTQVTVNAGHMEAKLLETPDGGTELSKLTATDGVTYEEKENQFIGSDLVYDANQSVINIKGDKTQPCMLNGAMVDGIKYDLKTEKARAQIRSPGALQLK